MLAQALIDAVKEAVINPVLQVIVLTFLPLVELRWSIPHGLLFTDLALWQVFLIAVITNILLGLFLFWILDWVIKIFCKIPWIKKCYDYYVVRTQKRIHNAVEKYGDWGLAIFIGIPFPGSGVYSGALAAKLLGFEWKEFILGCVVGVVIAGILVTLITTGGIAIFT